MITLDKGISMSNWDIERLKPPLRLQVLQSKLSCPRLSDEYAGIKVHSRTELALQEDSLRKLFNGFPSFHGSSASITLPL